MNDLAILGGDPAFERPLHVGAPNIGDRAAFLARVEDLLDRRWLTNRGPYVQEFEERLADRLEARNVVAVCNATTGIEIATRALGMAGEVIVPAFTFVATAHALRWQRIRPVFADVDPRTHLLDPVAARGMVTPSTTGIVAVHLWGTPVDIAALEAVAAEHDLSLVIDAAHAFASSYPDGRPIGTRGHAEVFSFHATKMMNTFEGGAVVTDDDDLAERIRLMTNFGFTGRDQVDHLGINGKMSEVAAAMGLTQLETLDEVLAVNRVNHAMYRRLLDPVPGLHVLTPDTGADHNRQYVVVEVDTEAFGLDRDTVVHALEAENVQARRYFAPGVHRMEPYRSEQPHAGLLLPETERLVDAVMTLPTGTAVGPADIDLIGRLLVRLHDQAPSIRRAVTRTDLVGQP